MRFSFVYQNAERAADLAREIVARRTGVTWEKSPPELEVIGGLREKTPALVRDIVERVRGQRPPPHRERGFRELMIERLVALDELDEAHAWLESPSVALGPVWLERCPSLEPLRGHSRFHGARAMHHLANETTLLRSR